MLENGTVKLCTDMDRKGKVLDIIGLKNDPEFKKNINLYINDKYSYSEDTYS